MTALNDVRVLDLTRILAGPYCTQILADHGADVWKLERPGKGDDTRAFGPPFVNGESTYFMSINRGKRSVAVDLKHPKGRAVARELAAKADVVVENFRPGTAAKLGLGAEELRASNPRLIYCSMSGFGHTGPWRDRPGYDLAIQGMSGLQSLTGAADGPPTKAGISMADLATGLYAAQGILMALYRREKTGQGDTVDIGMLDVMTSLLTYHATSFLAAGTVPFRKGNRHPSIVPYETFATTDGYMNLAVGNDRIWRLFCTTVDHPEWADDARFATNPDRVRNHGELFALLSELIAGRSTDDWMDLLRDAGVPCGPIYNVDETLELDHLHAREMIVPLSHPVAGDVRVVGSPTRLTDAPPKYELPPPLVGEHTEAVLGEVLGYSNEQIQALVAAEAVAVRADM